MSNEKEEIQPSFPKQLQQDSNPALQPPETTAPNGDGNNDRERTRVSVAHLHQSLSPSQFIRKLLG